MPANDVVIGLRLEKKGMVSGLADVKAGFDLVYGATAKVTRAFDEAVQHGVKYTAMQSSSVIQLQQAQEATKGLVDKMSLLQASNMATAMGVDVTTDSFAQMAEAAVIMSRRIGTDADTALKDLITGLSRQSRVILDNLGIVVSSEQAYKDYAAAIGVSVTALTDKQKREAFTAVTMKEVKRLTEGQTLAVRSAGEEWQKTKAALDDAYTSFSQWLSESAGIGVMTKALSGWAMMLRDLTDAIAGVNPELEALNKEVKLWSGSKGGQFLIEDFEFRKGGKFKTSALEATSMITPSEELEALRDRRAAQAIDRRESQRGRGGRRRASNDFTAPSFTATVEDAERAGDMLRQEETLPVLNEMLREYETRTMANAIAESAQKQRIEATTAAMQSKLEAYQLSSEMTQQLNDDMQNLAMGGLQSMATGLWAAADAALQGGDSFGTAMAKMLKATLLGLAQQSTVKALFNLAEAAAQWYNPVAVAMHLKAAGIYAAIAAGAGAGGLGLSAATASPGGGSARSGNVAPAAQDQTNRPSFGTRTSRNRRPQPIHVNVYLGDRNNPSALLLAKQQATAAVQASMS